MAALAAAGLPVAVVNPRQVRAFAPALGYLAPTAARDARGLAHFGAAAPPRPRRVAEPEAQALAARVGRRPELVPMRAMAPTRQPPPPVAAGRAQIGPHVAWRRQAVAELDAALAQRRRASPVWREPAAWLTSVPGGGPVVPVPWLAAWPDLGTRSRPSVAARVGVAPVPRESGRYRGPRHVRGGRALVRSVRSMATRVAVRFHPTLRTHSQRRLAAGQPKQVALVACMRKLRTILNAMLRDGTAWRSAAPTAA